MKVLEMNSETATGQAIAKLNHGIKHEDKWSAQHRAEVLKLIQFLESGSKDIEDLQKY